MSGLAAILRNHIEYTTWATNRLLAAASQIPPEKRQHNFGTADKSIQGTLTHLLRSERNWLRRMHEGTGGTALLLPEDESWDALGSQWKSVHQGWHDWIQSLSDDDVVRVQEYKDTKGEIWKLPIWQIILHVVNHSTHHRGQVSGFLRTLGHPPPPLDFVLYVRDHPAPSS